MGFRKAGETKVGGKFLVYGDTACGKSYFSLTFPAVGAIDTESGVIDYEGKDIEINGKKYNNLLMINPTCDLGEIEEVLEDLLDGEYKELKTITFDSETKLYYNMQIGAMEVEERRARKKGEDPEDQVVSQRQWGRIKLINMRIQQAKLDLSSRGIHIVSIAQESDLYSDSKVIGVKPDMHKSAKFDYSTILKFYTKQESNKIKYFAEVIKDRTNVTKKGDILENPTYDIWKDYYEGKSKLQESTTHYSKDTDNSIEQIETEAELSAQLYEEFKTTVASLSDKTKLKTKLTEMKLEVKDVKNLHSKQLQEIINFIK